jgi:hypothetical protein
VGEQGVEAFGGFETGIWGDVAEDEPEVDAAAALGWIIANCLRRRRLRYRFLGAVSISSPNAWMLVIRASWWGGGRLFRPPGW